VGTSAGATDGILEGMLGVWKRGMLTFWVLGLLSLRPMYGLEIKKEIERSRERRVRLGPSALYQLLRRLGKRRLVQSRWQPTTKGPPRACYEATEAGRAVVSRYIAEVLSSESPIPTALGQLMAALMPSEAQQAPPGR